MTNWEAESSSSIPPERMIGTAASWPAEVTLVADIRTACIRPSPLETAKIPKAKATEK